MGIEERKERERQMRRQQIMDAAKKVFASKGFGGATMENIAEEAEFSPATLYLYFKNKDELFASLNLRMLQDLISRVEGVRDQKDLVPEKRIMALEKALYEVYLEDPLNVVNVLRFQSRGRLKSLSPELSGQIRECTRQYIRAIADLFQEGVRQGAFLDCHPVAFAEIVWSIFAGLVLNEDTKRGLDEGKDLLEPTLILALEIIGRGIMKN
ncbi:MAG: TetR/AcrR family transcriptional regulator [Deltaproteobacteria bacterium]|nr:TetR/AcrR family transcriptional regulator [Deltaproteobacteria bacterium]MBW2048511.1 TetR/AcrR family transcriptional regulator [Deltaproteobacteria bacterium]MBW2111917.1 TetR/AcrR family transcriptional regulator [Deltaproteobacteria bacterium]MBW2353660.1 TetR/AcrR family transcriptional regulator [Deltaproteobacteria bacterium]HDZ90217.1 TetR/AcrR family transcriptional regulator [Deltaproteobacteria bacterium]